MSLSRDLKTGFEPYRDHLKEILAFLFQFIKNPIESIKRVPQWPWPQLIICFVSIAAITGTVSGILVLKLSKIFIGLIVFPISALLCGALVSGFFYYVFTLFFQKQIHFKIIFTIVTLSLIPFFALYSLSGIIPILNLVGLAISGILMIVGFTENTQIPRNKITKLIAGLYLIYMLGTIYNMISWQRENKSFKDQIDPDSIELLKKEFEN